MRLNYEKKLTARVAADSAKTLATHTVTELRARDGNYGHWRCQTPGTWVMGFDIVIWPGSLCYTGDMGDYLFQRTADMVTFMRRSCMSFDYAAEKCVAHDGRLREFRKEVFHEVLKDELDERVASGIDASERAKLKNTLAEIKDSFNSNDDKHDALSAMYESGLWDGCDMPLCDAWTYHFLWAMHAIQWFCDKLDRGEVELFKAAEVASV